MNGVIYNLKAYPLHDNKVSVSWKVDPGKFVPGDIFELKRGVSLNSLETITENITTNFFLDEIDLGSKWREFYYVVSLKRLSAATSTYIEVYSQSCNIHNVLKDPIASEISRITYIANKNYCGNIGKYLIRKTFGKRCNECFDVDFMAVKKHDCKVCYATTFEGGYFEPAIITPYEEGASPKKGSQLEPEKLEIESKNLTIHSYPIATPGDILIDRFNIMWRVDSVSYSKHGGAISSQILLCKRMDYNEVEYFLLERYGWK